MIFTIIIVDVKYKGNYNMKNKLPLIISITFLSASPLIANNLVCPALKYNDIKNVTRDGGEFTVGNLRFTLESGYASLPNWTNPLTKRNWAPTVASVEFEGTAMLKCNYTYTSSVRKKDYSFAIQALIREEVLIALANLGFAPNSKFDDIKKAYRNMALSAHPDKGGSVERMQELNNNYDIIKAHFGL